VGRSSSFVRSLPGERRGDSSSPRSGARMLPGTSVPGQPPPVHFLFFAPEGRAKRGPSPDPVGRSEETVKGVATRGLRPRSSLRRLQTSRCSAPACIAAKRRLQSGEHRSSLHRFKSWISHAREIPRRRAARHDRCRPRR
jgi:hypothetical protein